MCQIKIIFPVRHPTKSQLIHKLELKFLVTYESIDNIQTELTLILLEYMDEKRGERCRDFYTMMLIIPRLRILNEMFQRELINDVANHPEMSYPTFFWKVFVGKDTDNELGATLLEGLQTNIV
ncbi:hypothetical protein GJ496_011162 [Pomphorhynchus laevis]|nr:hypothetical protein GJ496_011162 [Pomphorhynchus laevis]